MTIWKFKNWCDAAVDGIVFPPDREKVHGELMNHLYDHYDDLVAQGLDKDTAELMALKAMGSAAEIAPQLAAIHRPFWGYLLRFTRILLALTLCTALVCAVTQLWRTHYIDPWEYGFDPYDSTVYTEQYTGRVRTYYTQPQQVQRSDGYTLTLTQAALWHSEYVDEQYYAHESDTLYFQIEVFNPRPWAANCNISRWFWAVDSLGNTYDCFNESIVNYAPYICGNSYHTGPLTYTHDMWINDYRSEDAEWIEFHYDRSGRDLVWRLDLTGGDAA